MNPVYLDTARVLTRVAPRVFVDDTFAGRYADGSSGLHYRAELRHPSDSSCHAFDLFDRYAPASRIAPEVATIVTARCIPTFCVHS